MQPRITPRPARRSAGVDWAVTSPSTRSLGARSWQRSTESYPRYPPARSIRVA
jgi:hypothetical protein